MSNIDFSRKTNDDEIVPEAHINLEKARQDALFNLTDQQEEAVKHNGSPLLILAGAGTGKTRCLTARMSYRIAMQYIMPSNILAITFTRKAAKEMKNRLEGIIGPTARALDVGTFHSICSNILRNMVEMSYLSQGFTTLNEEDQLKIIREIHQNEVANDTEYNLRIEKIDEDIIKEVAEIIRANRVKSAVTELHRLLAAKLIAHNEIDANQTRLKEVNSAVLPKNMEKHTLDEFQRILSEIFKTDNIKVPEYASHLVNEIARIQAVEYDSDKILKAIEEFKHERALAPSKEMEPEPVGYTAEYIKRLEASNSADYTDLIAEVCRMFRDKPSVLHYYRQLWRSIYIDEYQDTDDLQEYFISLLADPEDPEADLTVVGDDDQSVYSWRNARIENILTFNDRRPSSKLIRLEENFRSNQGILDKANNIISYNKERLGKELFSKNKETNTVQIFAGSASFENEYEERDFILKEVKKLRANGIPLKEIAIISRTAMVINPFQNEFIMNNIPFTFTAGRKFTETEKVKTIIAYLRLMRNESDDAAFQTAFSARPRSFGEKPLEAAIRSAQIKGVTARQMLEMMIMAGELKKKANEEISEFFDFITDLKKDMDEIVEDSARLEHINPSTNEYSQLHQKMTQQTELLLEKIQKDMRVSDDIQKLEQKSKNTNDKRESEKFSKEANQIKQHIQQLAKIVVEMKSIDDFLDSVTLTRADDENVEGVWVGTIHAAKGLEFEYVFLPGWEEEIFPSPKSDDSPGGIDEERRLAYVALTRPKNRCYVSHVKKPRIYLMEKMGSNGQEMHKASPFIEETKKQSEDVD